MASAEDFFGAWRLVSFQNESEDGRVEHPFGKSPSGMIYYDRSGHMGVNIMAEDRKNFSSGDMFVATEDEMKTAVKYISYSGRFTVAEDKVVHSIEVSFFPNWVGVDQERFYTIDGSRLVLSTRPMRFDGRKVVSRLVWEKL